MPDFAAFRSEMRRQAEDLASRVMASDAGQRMLAFHDQLGERDRLALRWLGWFAVCVLFYLLAIAPLVSRLDASVRRLEGERTLLAWLRAHDQRGDSPRAAEPSSDEPIATLINSTAEQSGLSIRRYEPSGEDGVRVWMEGAAFNALVKWLFLLEGTHGITASEFTIEREQEPGKVSARITLRS